MEEECNEGGVRSERGEWVVSKAAKKEKKEKKEEKEKKEKKGKKGKKGKKEEVRVEWRRLVILHR